MHRALILFLALLAAGPAPAAPIIVGDDLYVAGPDLPSAPPAQRDLFAAGFSATITQPTSADAHVAGYSVSVESRTGGDLYAAGSSVTLRAPVGGDASLAGATVRTTGEAGIAGNVRMAGGSVTVEGPIEGALTASGGELILNAPISGDAVLAAGSLRFGEAAKVGGTLRYTAPEPLEIPESVVPAARVQYSPPAEGTDWHQMAQDWHREMPGLWQGPSVLAWLIGSLLTLAFLVIVAALFLSFTPARVDRLYTEARSRPGLSLLAGVLGLSALIGLVPVTAMTLVGLPLVPIVLLAIVVLWVLGYLLGVFTAAMKVFELFDRSGTQDRRGIQLAVLAAGLVVAALLNFVPFLGWIINVGLLLLGLGALTIALAARVPREPRVVAPSEPRPEPSPPAPEQ